MTTAERRTFVKTLLDPLPNISDADIDAQLKAAADAITLRRCPWISDPTACAVPDRYETLMCRLAARYISRMGAEGEIGHNENGINRSYASPDDIDLLKYVIPLAKVVC